MKRFLRLVLEYLGNHMASPDAEDAARYRYVRGTTTAIRNSETGETIACTPAEFDAAVDLGRQQSM